MKQSKCCAARKARCGACNSTVGAVNIQTVKPELNSRSGSVEGGIGDYNRYGARRLQHAAVGHRRPAYRRRPRTARRLRRLSKIPRRADRRPADRVCCSGYGDIANFRPINGNQFAVGNQKYSAQNQTAFRASLLWHITPQLKWNVAYEKFADRGTPSANLMQVPRA
ncbi:hypothetical protein LP419_33890 [Massilia sp. H-1]|nr:hypothetical protein LP419_33890 [Massilia sp. H-1]